MTQTQMRALLVAVASLFAALAIGACGDDDDDGGDSGGDERRRRHDRLPPARNPDGAVRGARQASVRGQGQELCPDCEIEYQNADQDPAKQQSQVEAAVTRAST